MTPPVASASASLTPGNHPSINSVGVSNLPKVDITQCQQEEWQRHSQDLQELGVQLPQGEEREQHLNALKDGCLLGFGASKGQAELDKRRQLEKQEKPNKDFGVVPESWCDQQCKAKYSDWHTIGMCQDGCYHVKGKQSPTSK